MTRSRLARRSWALLAVATLLAGACDREPADEGRGPPNIPTQADALQGPGSPIGDGFSVVEGSWLVGAVFPHSGSAGPDARAIEGWNTVLVVDAHPLGVLQEYVDQAVSAGYSDYGALPRSASGVCFGEELPTPGPGPASREAEWFHCSIGALRPADGGTFDMAYLQLFAGKPRDCIDPCAESYASYITLNVTYSFDFAALGLPPSGASTAPPDIASVTLPQLPSVPKDLRLPRVGERVGADQRFFEGFVVEPGSQVVAPGAGLGTSGTGSFTVILRITRDPRSVLEAYVKQFRRLVPEPDRPSPVQTRRVGGVQQLHVVVAQFGGLAISVTTTPLGEEGPLFARVDVSSD